MKLLATIKAQDVEADDPHFDYESFKPRTAVRAIVFDGDKVALIYVREHGYYMLPGGGIDNNGLQAGLAREVVEELGCKVIITGEIGSAEVYMDRWQKKQTDYCYTARKVGDPQDRKLTDFETGEGHEIVWAPDLFEAINAVKEATPASRDGKLVRARDLLFLEAAAAKHRLALHAGQLEK
jgi:8-oxo-dGTP pyrophosphatase MutT (NUDIX family)